MNVLQSWLEKIPIRTQSTLILGLRGPDTGMCLEIKRICRWLRGLTFVPGNPDNVHEFMGRWPGRVVDKGEMYRELEFVSMHFYSHLMHAVEVIGYRHPDEQTANDAQLLYFDLCSILHVPVESLLDFEQRLGTREWPKGQPKNYEEVTKGKTP